jgi:acetyl esterase
MRLNSYRLPSLETEVKTEEITLNGVRVLVHRPLPQTGDARRESAPTSNEEEDEKNEEKLENLPKALVWFHGGGFTVGTADIDIRLASGLARDSARVVFNVDYRLAPENPFPAALEDAAAVVRAVVDQAQKLGVSGDDMATAGRSAGGNLATAVFHQLLMDNATAHYVKHFKSQALLVPATHSSCPTCYASSEAFAHGYGLTASLRTAFTRFYAGRGDEDILRDPRFSPMLADQVTLAQQPRALVVVAEADVLRDEGLAYAMRLELAGVPVQTRIMKGCIHTDLDRATLDMMADFLKA